MSRSRVLLGVLVVMVGVRWCAGGRGAARPRFVESPQVAVRSAGFAALDGAAGARRVTELDHDGAVEREARVALPQESRVIGTPSGTGAVWRDGDRIAVAGVGDDGRLVDPERFGTRALRLCDGAASNDARWGVGWLEGDGTVWIVFGTTSSPTRGLVADSAVPVTTTAGPPTWCGVASAEDRLVLLWRESADRVFLNFCARKRCSPFPRPIPPSLARATILAVGCVRDGCGFVTRGSDQVTRLGFVGERGQPKWTKPLDDAGKDSAAELIGAGDGQLALAYLAEDGHAVVERVDRKGALAPVWRSPSAAHDAPALAWSHDRLLIAGARDGRLVTEVIALPR